MLAEILLCEAREPLECCPDREQRRKTRNDTSIRKLHLRHAWEHASDPWRIILQVCTLSRNEHLAAFYSRPRELHGDEVK